MAMDFNVNVNVSTNGAEKVDTLEKKINSLKTESIKLKVNVDQSNLSKLKLNTNSVKIKPTVDTSGIKQVTKDFQMVKNLATQISQTKIKIAGLDTTKNSNEISVLQNQLKKMESDYKVLMKTLGSSFDKNQLGSLENIFGKADDKIAQINAKAKDLSQTMQSVAKPFSQLDATTASNKTLTWLKNNSKAAKDYGDRLKELAELQRTATNADDLKKYTKEVNNIKAEAAALGKTGTSLGTEFKRAIGQIGEFVGIYGGLQMVTNSIRTSISELKEMDSILTEISKVSEMTDSQLTQLGKDAFVYASKYGKKVTDYLQGVTEMNRSGFYGQQGVDLANLSVLAQAAGDMNADIANSYLLATNAAYEFKGSVEELNAVLDGQNMITNRHSVNMTDMAEATSKAASMASQTGVQVNELSAIIGTAVARTKQSGDIVGTALKSLFINLQDTSNSKIVDTFNQLGISQTEYINGSEKLKTPIELLKELANVYNALPDGSTLKADVLRNIGNKRQANVLAAILAGIDNGDYDSMLKDYSEGMGSAAKEAEKSANNWEGSLNKLSNSWTKFIGNFADSSQIITGVNSINSLVQALDGIVNVMTPLGTIATGVGIFEFFKNLDEPINHRVSA